MINKYTNQSQTQKNIQAQKIKFISKKQKKQKKQECKKIFFVAKDKAKFISNENVEKDKKNKTTNEKNNTNSESQKKSDDNIFGKNLGLLCLSNNDSENNEDEFTFKNDINKKNSEKEKENYPHLKIDNNNIKKKDEESKYIILNNKFYIIDMNPIFPQNNLCPKEPSEEIKDEPIKEKKEENSPNQLSLKEGENILKEFLQRKKKMEIEELNIKTQNKIQKIAKEKSELEDEALEFEKKGKELLEKGNQLWEETQRKREIIKMLEKNEETIKDNEKNEK